MPYSISKTFNVCYGHRVHNQFLRSELSDGRCKCRHLHGHNADIIVTLTADHLENGVVLDFNNLGFFKDWLDEYLDHRFVIDMNDPLLEFLYGVQWRNNITAVPFGREGVSTEDPLKLQWNAARLHASEILTRGENPVSTAITELYEGTLVVDFVPTSENLSRWIAEMLSVALQDVPGVRVKQVTWYETPKSQSTFSF